MSTKEKIEAIRVALNKVAAQSVRNYTINQKPVFKAILDLLDVLIEDEEAKQAV